MKTPILVQIPHRTKPNSSPLLLNTYSRQSAIFESKQNTCKKDKSTYQGHAQSGRLDQLSSLAPSVGKSWWRWKTGNSGCKPAWKFSGENPRSDRQFSAILIRTADHSAFIVLVQKDAIAVEVVGAHLTHAVLPTFKSLFKTTCTVTLAINGLYLNIIENKE